MHNKRLNASPRALTPELLPCSLSPASRPFPARSPAAHRWSRWELQICAEQGKGEDQQKESALEKAIRLLKQQQELQAELASLSAEAGDLNEDQKQQLQELLSTAQPPTMPEAAAWPPLQVLLQNLVASGLSEASDLYKLQRLLSQQQVSNPVDVEADKTSDSDLDKLQSLLSQLQIGNPLDAEADEAGRVEMPKEVKDFLSEAGVLNAVPWDGRPAQPSYGAFAPPPGGWPGQDADDIAADAEASVEDIHEDDDEQISGDNLPFEAGEGVDEFLELLESGQQLPPDPRVAGIKPEGPEKFVERIRKLKARYEAQFLDRKDWEISPEEFKALSEDWMPPPPGKSDEPVVPQDIEKVVPAPELPPDVEKQSQRFQWILFLLRKAHMQPSPDAPVKALIAAGLARDKIVYEDAVVELEGKLVYQEYMQRVEEAGGRMEILNLWGDMSKDRPHPQWRVYLDTWLNLPYPAWYREYCVLHAEHNCPPNLRGMQAAESPAEPAAANPDFWEPPPLRPPKRQPGTGSSDEEPAPVVEQLASFVTDRSQRPALEGALLPGEGAAYKWLPVLRQCQALAARWPLKQGRDCQADADTAAGPYDGSSAVSNAQEPLQGAKHSRGYQWGARDKSPWAAAGPRRARRRRRAASTALKWDKPENCGPEQEAVAYRINRPAFGATAGSQPKEASQPRPPVGSLKRPTALSACIVSLPGTGSGPLAAERSGFQLLSFADTHGRGRVAAREREEDRAPWPDAEEPGQAWHSGGWFSIPLTLCYSMDNSSGQVHRVECKWNAIMGHVLGTERDLVDVYLRETGLHPPTSNSQLRLTPFSLVDNIS